MKRLALASIAISISFPALADPDPAQQLLFEANGRIITLMKKLDEAGKTLDAEKKRADEAEKQLKELKK